MRQLQETFLFQDNVSSVGDGKVYSNQNSSTLSLEIYGTATARTIQFYALNSIGEKIALNGYNVSNSTLATSTSGTTSEKWIFDITGLYKIVMVVSSISGGNITVQGEVLN